ncbi:GerAB/ArcD/ProY family transporter [Sporolactobacillus pectinivorans]|uniref:GerAB/ArcD/ProY family transporter n=1 Tax=Sporolactobacillus pectinivorans TaxID=1591408 RepID=UPI000C25B068|nr:GerAB/ArcD/ProY family transporter [Sporolactobacillus pectinivorans]
MKKISKHQLFVLVMMEQIGSTNLWALGIEARQDAWLVILFSMLPGCALIWIFTELHRHFPNDNLAGLTTTLLGKAIGWPLAFLYVLLGLFNSTRNANEFTELLNMTFLQRTPSSIVLLLFLITLVYISFLGVENFVRLTEIILPFMLILISLIYVLILASGRIDLQQLTPVLENGMMPVLKASYPTVVNFPFGMSLVLFQFWHFANDQKSVRKVTLTAAIFAGIILTLTQVTIITTLGVDLAAGSALPILRVVKLISISDILTNFDALGIFLIFIGGFYITAVHMFSASMLLSTLFRIKDYRWFILPLAAFVFWYSGVYEPNYPFHVKFLPAQSWQQFVPLYDAAPILLLLIFWLKKYNAGISK